MIQDSNGNNCTLSFFYCTLFLAFLIMFALVEDTFLWKLGGFAELVTYFTEYSSALFECHDRFWYVGCTTLYCSKDDNQLTTRKLSWTLKRGQIGVYLVAPKFAYPSKQLSVKVEISIVNQKDSSKSTDPRGKATFFFCVCVYLFLSVVSV